MRNINHLFKKPFAIFISVNLTVTLAVSPALAFAETLDEKGLETVEVCQTSEVDTQDEALSLGALDEVDVEGVSKKTEDQTQQLSKTSLNEDIQDEKEIKDKSDAQDTASQDDEELGVSTSSQTVTYRKADNSSFEEINQGTRTFENGTLDLRSFGTNSLSVGADYDQDGLLDEDEVIVFEKDGQKCFRYKSDPFKADSDGDGIIDSKDPDPLTWNISARDGYIFSKLSYKTDEELDNIFTFNQGKVESSFEKLESKNEGNVAEEKAVELGNKTVITAQRELARYWRPAFSWHKEASGLDAYLFEFNSEIYPYLNNKGNYMLAFRGSSDTKDFVDDGWLAAGKWTSQGGDVVGLGNDLVNGTNDFKDFDINRLSCCGHSLGGYLSQVFLANQQGGSAYKTAMNSNLALENIYTFNSAKIVAKNGFFFGSPQNVKDYAKAADNLNAKHKFDSENPYDVAHRNFVINGEVVNATLGSFKSNEKIGKIVPVEASDNPTRIQAHYLSNFARDQYAQYFDFGERKGFSETEVLALQTNDQDYLEDMWVGKLLPYSITVKDSKGSILSYNVYLQKQWTQKVLELIATDEYEVSESERSVVFVKKQEEIPAPDPTPTPDTKPDTQDKKPITDVDSKDVDSSQTLKDVSYTPKKSTKTQASFEQESGVDESLETKEDKEQTQDTQNSEETSSNEKEVELKSEDEHTNILGIVLILAGITIIFIAIKKHNED